MSENSNIEWTDHTWSPWDGCTKVSPGCANCYAEARDKRHLIEDVDHWGKGAPRRLRVDWKSPVKWDLESLAEWDNARGKGLPLTLPPRHKVFPSLCDWLDDEVPIEWLSRFLQLIHDTPHLDWLLLTKRPENFGERILRALAHVEGIDYESADAWEGDANTECGQWLNDWSSDDATPPSNVWIGTSVEDQTLANQRVPALLRIPARLRFLSVEPLLGEIDLSGFLWGKDPVCVECPRDADCVHGWHTRKANDQPSLDWVIVGGESGRGARPCNVDWVRSIVMQCADAGVPCFVKQFGARPVTSNANLYDFPESVELREPWDDLQGSNADGFAAARIALKHPKGGDPSEWPEQLHVRQFPEAR